MRNTRTERLLALAALVIALVAVLVVMIGNANLTAKNSALTQENKVLTCRVDRLESGEFLLDKAKGAKPCLATPTATPKR
jgi:cell division protein FtsB